MFNGQSERDVEAAALALFDALERLVDEQLDTLDELLTRLENAHPPHERRPEDD